MKAGYHETWKLTWKRKASVGKTCTSILKKSGYKLKDELGSSLLIKSEHESKFVNYLTGMTKKIIFSQQNHRPYGYEMTGGMEKTFGPKIIESRKDLSMK